MKISKGVSVYVRISCNDQSSGTRELTMPKATLTPRAVQFLGAWQYSLIVVHAGVHARLANHRVKARRNCSFEIRLACVRKRSNKIAKLCAHARGVGLSASQHHHCNLRYHWPTYLVVWILLPQRSQGTACGSHASLRGRALCKGVIGWAERPDRNGQRADMSGQMGLCAVQCSHGDVMRLCNSGGGGWE